MVNCIVYVDASMKTEINKSLFPLFLFAQLIDYIHSD